MMEYAGNKQEWFLTVSAMKDRIPTPTFNRGAPLDFVEYLEFARWQRSQSFIGS